MFCIAEKWHQIDGVAYIYGERRLWERLYDYMKSKDTAENRERALLTYLPKWNGFLVNEPVDKMTATEALVELDRVVSCLFTNVRVQESYLQSDFYFNPDKRRPPDFSIKTVSAWQY